MLVFVVCCGSTLICAPVFSEDAGPDAKQLHQNIIQRGVRYLQTQGQAGNGSYSAGSGPA